MRWCGFLLASAVGDSECNTTQQQCSAMNGTAHAFFLRHAHHREDNVGFTCQGVVEAVELDVVTCMSYVGRIVFTMDGHCSCRVVPRLSFSYHTAARSVTYNALACPKSRDIRKAHNKITGRIRDFP